MNPKFFVLPADGNGNIDATIEHGLIDFMPGRVQSEAEADFVLVPVCYLPNYKFNEALLGITKPMVVLDYLEFGWDAGDKPNLLGTGVIGVGSEFGHLATHDWGGLSFCFHHENVPKLVFKRELFERDRSDTLLPIEWPCRHEIPPVQTKEQFDARPIEVFHCWGYSHPARVHLHAQIFEAMADKGIEVMDRLEHPRDRGTRTWATIYSPWYARAPLAHVLAVQQQAKISVSMPGAGVKCFRHSEAPIGSLMALPFDNLAWSYPWIDRINSIRLELGNECQTLINDVCYEDLQPIYLEGQRNLENYRSQNYATNYILPAIERIL